MSAAAPFPAVAASGHDRIPVLDIGPYLAGDPGAAAPLARAIARTCEDTGFLVVANHGVPSRLAEDTFAVAAPISASVSGGDGGKARVRPSCRCRRTTSRDISE